MSAADHPERRAAGTPRLTKAPSNGHPSMSETTDTHPAPPTPPPAGTAPPHGQAGSSDDPTVGPFSEPIPDYLAGRAPEALAARARVFVAAKKGRRMDRLIAAAVTEYLDRRGG